MVPQFGSHLRKVLQRVIPDEDLKGEASEIVPAFVAKKKIDILVMGSVGRTGIPGFFIGNTAEDILRKVQCSVVAVKPQGFTCPIT